MIQKQLSIDFDGVIAIHEYPFIGAEVPHALRVIQRLKDAGHILILQTMRADDLLQDALTWCKKKGLEFHHINCNPNYETGSRKIYSHVIIDDHALGVPIMRRPFDNKPMVDWIEIEKILQKQGYL
jgi:hypothetical protein